MIAVVDDDVCFAEEVQDLLAANGHRSVVVVSHPHESSLQLLESAHLLILDLSLAATTALDVLEEMRSRGSNPSVVMVSGSGADVLETARASAIDRGFCVLAALPKPLSAPVLLGLLAGRSGLADPPIDRRSAGPGTPILLCSSLDYAGSYLAAAGPDESPAAALMAALAAQRDLAMRGQRGFVALRLADAALVDPAICTQLCSGPGHSYASRSQIVLELGPEVQDDPWPRAASMAELRLAGYGLMIHARPDQLPTLAALRELPITMLGIDARLTRLSPRLPRLAESLRRTMEHLRRRTIVSLCAGLQSAGDLRRVRDIGFDMVSRSACRPAFDRS